MIISKILYSKVWAVPKHLAAALSVVASPPGPLSIVNGEGGNEAP
jgi:hypothetical protein